jgi:hypothetical protein
MRKLYFLLALLIIPVGFLTIHMSQAHADFTANNIIDDNVFNNTSSMTASKIDSWLNANFPSSCISSNRGFTSVDPIGYNPTQGFIFGNPVSAGKVVYDAAQAYGINPQVLLTTMQKEEGLVQGDGPYGCGALSMSAAMGFACTDSGTNSHSYSYPGSLSSPLYYSNGSPVNSVTNTCVNSAAMAGFSEQVIWAAWLLEKGLQRSEGNVNWAVINANWDNSDESNCYGGPMTQGYRERCRTDSAPVYYDGYTTIDGQSTHMDTGATASLYWYTPHFHGNQMFYDVFTTWFGSTHYPEPVGGAVYLQNSTGKIYLVTNDNNTRYYIPSWSLLQIYRLDRYQIIGADDTTINAFTDGGTLTSLVWDNSGVYLVNNAVKYHFPSSTTCTDWGYDCSDSAKVKQLGASFQSTYLSSGTNLGWLSQYGGVYYKMSGGKKLVIANSKTLSALGATPDAALSFTAANNWEPLGQLLISNSTPIKFKGSATIYYVEGGLAAPHYHPISSGDTLDAWNITSAFQPPASAYDTSPPASDPTSLNQWYTDGTNKYLVDGGRKFALNATQQQLWPAATYQTYWSALAANLPSATLQTYVTDGKAIYALDTQKHHVPTYDDYLALKLTPNIITTLKPFNIAAIASGADALGDGKLIAVNSAVYVINANKSSHIPDATTFNVFGFNWGKIYSYDSSILTSYPSQGDLKKFKTTDGGYSYVLSQWRLCLTSQMAADYGLKTASFAPLSGMTTATLNQGIPVSQFIYDIDSGKVYYASGGGLHYVQSYSSFVGYGGLKTPSTTVDSDFISNFFIGQPV